MPNANTSPKSEDSCRSFARRQLSTCVVEVSHKLTPARLLLPPSLEIGVRCSRIVGLTERGKIAFCLASSSSATSLGRGISISNEISKPKLHPSGSDQDWGYPWQATRAPMNYANAQGTKISPIMGATVLSQSAHSCGNPVEQRSSVGLAGPSGSDPSEPGHRWRGNVLMG
jgi:hypothetical protein